MAGLRFYLFLAAICSCSVLGLGELSPSLKARYVAVDPKPVEPLAKEAATEVVPATTPEGTDETDGVSWPWNHNTTTSSTTSTSSTTTSSTTPSTTSSTTTTTPSTTTSSSTTTTTTPSTTTSSTTTTPQPPTPAPAPKPVPAPEQGTWMYTDAKNVTCILAQFAAQIKISYSQLVNNKSVIGNFTMNVPINASVVDGNCNASATDQWMLLSWPSEASAAANSILMLYRRNDTTKNYALHTFNLTVDASQLVNASFKTDSIVLMHGEEWTTPLTTSYRCAPVTRLSMSNETYGASASVAVSALQEEAFRTVHGKGFSVARECGSGDVPDGVPIAVGVSLAALVVVVLIAYLAARRRAASGYLSM